MDNKAIGVLDSDSIPTRSVRDQQLQIEFGTGNMELYGNGSIGVLSGLSQRTKRDIDMQKMFNPYYKGQAETFKFPYKVNGNNISSLSAEPNNPYSGLVRRVPLQ